MAIIMGFWRNTKGRCKKCHRPITKGYEIRPQSVVNMSDKLKKLVPIGIFCPYCAKGISQALSDEADKMGEE